MNNEIPARILNPSNQPVWKLLMIGFIVLILMIPAIWIAVLIEDRDQRKEGVVDEIAGKWGAAQTVSGPFICIPYSVSGSSTDSGGAAVASTSTKYLYLAADSLQIDGKIKAVTHKRGIFDVSGYSAELDLSAVFAPPVLNQPGYHKLPLRWDEALLAFDLSDQRGMKELDADFDGQKLLFNRSQGVLQVAGFPQPEDTKCSSRYRDGAEKKTDFKLAAALPGDLRNSAHKIKLHMQISGTQELSFASSGLRQWVQLEGDWKSPSFIGDLLPENRILHAKGFGASWQTNSLSSGIKQLWTSDEPIPQLSNLGVNFLIMVDSYQQTSRALKYSVLFLVLTFMTFFFAEIMTKQRIHPIQYLMVGCALIIFYLLLLSISEHLSFGLAYLIAACGVVLQISLYCSSILKSKGFALKVSALLAFLYTFLFFLLRLQDSALLVGSISLFALLCVAMYISSRINWYNREA